MRNWNILALHASSTTKCIVGVVIGDGRPSEGAK
jgi:hypothetical protein